MQHFYDDGTNFMIICFYKEQALLWKQLKSFEIDMNYKHLGAFDEREIIWGWYNPISAKGKSFINGLRIN